MARLGPHDAIAGGLGTGTFQVSSTGAFGYWRMEPALPARTDPAAVKQDRFHVWARQGPKTFSQPLVAKVSSPFLQACLYPVTWTAFPLDSFPITLESAGFSPLLPGDSAERSLPIYIMVFRANNPTSDSIEVAMMLTWACGWPKLVKDSTFDFQHDNLCLTGSLGSPTSQNRQGIAVPDVHYVGIFQQGIEQWVVPDEEAEVLEDFAEDGELDPRIVGSTPHGAAAAWVKFDLDPGETKEAPFVLAWHFPQYESGPAAGKWRRYTRYLGRHRPDNAIVWLAEQAVQRYGAETANYKYWMQQLRDWQHELGPEAGEVCAAIEAVVRVGTIWPHEGELAVTGDLTAEQRKRVSSVWPDLR